MPLASKCLPPASIAPMRRRTSASPSAPSLKPRAPSYSYTSSLGTSTCLFSVGTSTVFGFGCLKSKLLSAALAATNRRTGAQPVMLVSRVPLATSAMCCPPCGLHAISGLCLSIACARVLSSLSTSLCPMPVPLRAANKIYARFERR